MVTKQQVEAVLKRTGYKKAKLVFQNSEFHCTEGYAVDAEVDGLPIVVGYTMGGVVGQKAWAGDWYLNQRLVSLKEYFAVAGIDATIEQERLIIRREGGRE